MPTSTQSFVVVGAGVLGLSTATILQGRYPNRPIEVIAAEFPSLPATWTTSTRPSADYASMWAGAHYRPIPRSDRQLREEAELAIQTARVMYEIAQKNPEAGVALMPAAEYLEEPPDHYAVLKTGDVYAGPGDKFRVLEGYELPPGAKFGCEYLAYCINVHIYCSWLLNNFIAKGGIVSQKVLSNLEEVYTPKRGVEESIVINCSGRNFDHDPKVKIIRGQTVLVKNQYHRTETRQNKDGGWSFLIPRPGGDGTVVGGTKEVGDLEVEARPETRQRLLAGAVRAFPNFVKDISKFDVVMDNVGRRPWREGGLRIEAEILPEGQRIFHAYGAGGRGYEVSWGVAAQVADLVDRYERTRSRL